MTDSQAAAAYRVPLRVDMIREQQPARGDSIICVPIVHLEYNAFKIAQITGVTMKFTIVLDRDEDGIWIAECPAIPGCVSQGKTRQEALHNIREAIELCLEVRAELGYPLSVETHQVEVFA
jgi:predicted RNase H-like HicB family nuclease